MKRLLAARWRHGRVTARLPDGEVWQLGDATAAEHARVEVLDDGFFLDVLLGGELGAGESYMRGAWRADDLPLLLRLFVRNLASLGFDGPIARLGQLGHRVRHLLRRNSRAGSARNISAHYDLGNDFYRLFLDETMAYSCAVFAAPGDSLEAAQRAKFDRVCDLVALSPRDHLLEIGSGWGGFAVHAAATRGCRVTTVTISREQWAGARARVQAAGLGDRVDVQLRDYRDLAGRYDKIASIEMFEAVGHEFHGAYFAACDRVLAPGGVMALQTIAMPDRRYRAYRRAVDWHQTYIFPGACIPSLAAIAAAVARSSGLTIRRVDDIGPHYAPTLAAWRQRFFARLPEVRALGFDDVFIRTWDLYLAFSEASFAERSLFDLQIVLAR